TPTLNAKNKITKDGVAADLQSAVYFDATGEKVLNALGYDKEGKEESLSAFRYWTDDTTTPRREDKNIRKIEQWATNLKQTDIDAFFGAALPTLNAKNKVTKVGFSADLQSAV